MNPNFSGFSFYKLYIDKKSILLIRHKYVSKGDILKLLMLSSILNFLFKVMEYKLYLLISPLDFATYK